MTRNRYAAARTGAPGAGTVAKPGAAAVLLTLIALLAMPGPGTASLTAGGSTTGGATAPGEPMISDVICLSGCTSLRTAAVGGVLQVSGRELSLVTRAALRGREGAVRAPVGSATETSVRVRVPQGARSGPVRVADDFGSASGPSPRITVVPRGALRSSSGLELVGAETAPRRAYLFGTRPPSLRFVIASGSPSNDLRIDVVKNSGEIVQSYFRQGVKRNTVQQVTWDGRNSGGRPARGGSYSFRVSSQSGERARVNRRQLRQRGSSQGGHPLGFELYPYTFPVRSRVGWGDGLGAGRNHQGQDLMTSCGRPVVAARGGRVTYRGDYEGAAGNYVVIAGFGTPYDFAYMHLQRPVSFRVGQVVRTGQLIGRVGATGRTTACHLHFEMWSAPGWYKGGSPVSPLPHLRSWYGH